MTHPLTSLQRQDLRYAFDLFDTDKSGKISPNELRNVFKELNMPMNDNELKALIQDVDTNQNGEIEFDEFCRAMTKIFVKKFSEEELRAVFRQFDQDGSGYIEAKELGQIMHKMGKPCTKSQIDKLLKSIDTSRDGKISFEEFAQLF